MRECELHVLPTLLYEIVIVHHGSIYAQDALIHLFHFQKSGIGCLCVCVRALNKTQTNLWKVHNHYIKGFYLHVGFFGNYCSTTSLPLGHIYVCLESCVTCV